jgi:sugar lactone lactonase YvrE
MIVLDAAGNVTSTWGGGIFTRPHAVRMTSQGTLLCVDDGAHALFHCTVAGEVLAVIGAPGVPAAAHSGLPFNRPTDAAIAGDGSYYISDGYGNARVHHFDPDGRWIASWGAPGTGPGEFNLPHNILVSGDFVYVADRENHRIQVFDLSGAFQGFFGAALHRPSGIALLGEQLWVAEIGPYLSGNFGWPGLGPRLSVLDSAGQLLARVEADPPAGPGDGQFISPHAIAVAPDRTIYVADVVCTGWPSLFPHEPPPANLSGLHRLTPLEAR